MSAAAEATLRNARPRATRGVGCSMRARAAAKAACGSASGAAEHLQRQSGVAQRATDVEVVAGLCAAAQQRLPGRDFTEHRDTDGQRTARGVAADELAVVRVGQCEQSARKAVQPDVVSTRQGQREVEGQRLRATGGQVASG